MKKILVINGANLNMLGKREPHIYGTLTLKSIEALIEQAAGGRVQVEFFQSNHEGAIIDKLHEFCGDGIIINAGAFTHYSYAIADALRLFSCPKAEVHISNIYQREEFRKNSVLADACDRLFAGLGEQGYVLALESIISELQI